MRRKAWAAAAAFGVLAAGLALTPGDAAAPDAVRNGAGAPLSGMDRLAFGPDGVLFVADNRSATVTALRLPAAPEAAAGTADVEALDRVLADLMGVSPGEAFVNDLAVHPATGNAFVSATRISGETGLFRIDGAGKVVLLNLEGATFSQVVLPNPPRPGGGARAGRTTTVTDMAYAEGRLYLAGLSNEEFASNLKAVDFPFKGANRGVGVEIYHGAHGGFETHSPAHTLLPVRLDGRMQLLAAYICTPLVRIPVSDIGDGGRIRGSTVAELGRHNRPLDMVRYSRDGRDYVLMSNTKRGLLRFDLAEAARAPSIEDAGPSGDTWGVPAQKIRSPGRVEQLDLLDDERMVVLARGPGLGAALDLKVAALP